MVRVLVWIMTTWQRRVVEGGSGGAEGQRRQVGQEDREDDIDDDDDDGVTHTCWLLLHIFDIIFLYL